MFGADMPLLNAGRGPAVVDGDGTAESLLRLVADSRQALIDGTRRYPGILFRGFNVSNPEAFERFGDALTGRAVAYTFRSTPRTEIGRGVFTATDYPADQEIALHCENAYQTTWPLGIAFCCITRPSAGGQTHLANVRDVTRTLTARTVAEFQARGVRYVRHYHDHVDLPWQEVFQTTDRSEVVRYCAAHQIECTWLGAVLRTAHRAQGVARHPTTNELLFFNQAHLFHPSNLPGDVREALESLYGGEQLPRTATFGDGEAIPDAMLAEVRAAYEDCSFQFDWNEGDVLLLDNMLVAHGRRSFTGARRILTSMFDSISTS